jgi:hypothetical protein
MRGHLVRAAEAAARLKAVAEATSAGLLRFRRGQSSMASSGWWAGCERT